MLTIWIVSWLSIAKNDRNKSVRVSSISYILTNVHFFIGLSPLDVVAHDSLFATVASSFLLQRVAVFVMGSYFLLNCCNLRSVYDLNCR